MFDKTANNKGIIITDVIIIVGLNNQYKRPNEKIIIQRVVVTVIIFGLFIYHRYYKKEGEI